MFSTGAGIAVTDPQHVQSSTIFPSKSPTDLADWEKQRSVVDCQVCRIKQNASVQLEASWVLIGPDDPVRGYACLVFGRHAIELHELTEAEGTALMRDIRKLSAAVARIMKPMKMNYEVHGNTAPHLHVHFFPRYRGDQFEGGLIDPRVARRSACAPGEFERFRYLLNYDQTASAA